ncbi:MAG: hypothetical protein QOH79_830 [Acidimicrobiaceae bacterium]
MRRRLGQSLLAIAITFGPMVAVAPPASAVHVIDVAITAPQAEGLRYESHSVFTLDLAAHAVHVQVAITVTNQQPSYTSGNIIHQFYFPQIGVPVLSEATNFAATRDNGTALSVAPEDTPSPRVKIAAVTLKPALYYPQSQAIEFDYDLPAQPPRSQGLTRVNDAFSSFIAFGYGDPGMTSVQIKVPSSLDAEIVGVDMTRVLQGDQIVFNADGIDDPNTWTAAVDAHNDAQLVQKEETVDGQRIVIKGWPDDPQWVDFVDGQLKKGLLELEKLIGQPWPDSTKDLTVTETAAPYLYGYAGWYNPLKNAIDIGDELDPVVVLHEIAHTWFNKDVFVDRWISEAFAEEYATRALEKTGEPLKAPDPITPDAAGSVKLNDWGKPRLQDSESIDEEHFGYTASWTVLRKVTDEVGMDAMARVVDAAKRKLIAYQGHPAAEQLTTTTDWKRLLDLLEEVGGSKNASDLFKSYVIGLSDAELFLRHADAQTSYQKFVDASGDWSAPLAVRSAMSEWEFARATRLIGDAEQVQRTRDQIADTLRPLGRAVPPTLRQHYESQGGADLQPLIDEANQVLDASHHIVDANSAVHSGHGIAGTFGLLFAGADDKVHKAESALEKGDTAAAISLADSAHRQANDATKAGVTRMVILLLVAAAAYAMWTWGRPFALRTVHSRAEKKRKARDAALPAALPAAWPEWATPLPPEYTSAPPQHPPYPPPVAPQPPPDPSAGGPEAQDGDGF